MKSSYIGAILIGVSSLMSFALIAADSEVGKAKSVLCAGCHGVDGNSPNGTWPILAGQHASYLVKQMKDFKSAERTDPIMQSMVAALSEADMQDIAAYFASQKVNPIAFDKSWSKRAKVFIAVVSATSRSPPAWPVTARALAETPLQYIRPSRVSTRNTWCRN